MFFIFNWDLYTKLALLKPKIKDNEKYFVYDLISKEEYEFSKDGVLINLSPQERKILVLLKDKLQDKKISFMGNSDIINKYETTRNTEEKSRIGKQKGITRQLYPVDASKAFIVDLKKFANRNFEDDVAGDGKGGWTDEGRDNSLVGVPWEMQNFLGVPCNIIRWDHNEDKACIVLASKKSIGVPEKVEGIPVEESLKSIYFFHTSAWTEQKKEAFKYRIHYIDNTTLDILIIGGIHVNDWWVNARDGVEMSKFEAKIAWSNSDKRGFYCYKWDNPNKGKIIKSIDIISSNNNSIPIIIAITGEKN
jgi:hypothetical protein